jgi:hypothetical protein
VALQLPFEFVERSFERGRLVFGYFPGSSRGSGQFQPQLHASSVAGAQRVPFDTRPQTDRFRRKRVQMPLQMVRGQFANLLRDAGMGRIIETAEADELFQDRHDRGVRMVLFDLDAPLGCRFSGRFGDAQRQHAVFKSGLCPIEIDARGQRDRALKVSKRPLDPIASLFFARRFEALVAADDQHVFNHFEFEFDVVAGHARQFGDDTQCVAFVGDVDPRLKLARAEVAEPASERSTAAERIADQFGEQMNRIRQRPAGRRKRYRRSSGCNRNPVTRLRAASLLPDLPGALPTGARRTGMARFVFLRGVRALKPERIPFLEIQRHVILLT